MCITKKTQSNDSCFRRNIDLLWDVRNGLLWSANQTTWRGTTRAIRHQLTLQARTVPTEIRFVRKKTRTGSLGLDATLFAVGGPGRMAPAVARRALLQAGPTQLVKSLSGSNRSPLFASGRFDRADCEAPTKYWEFCSLQIREQEKRHAL